MNKNNRLAAFRKQEPDEAKLKNACGGMAVEAGGNNGPARKRSFPAGVPGAEDAVFTL
jgi:hypothetical protein